MAIPLVPDAESERSAYDSTHLPPFILTRLRSETREQHKDLERVLDLMGMALTRDIYCRRLVQYYGFYCPLEAALRTRCGVGDDGGSTPSSDLATLIPRFDKTRLLRQDLQHFQITAEALPLCRELPSIETPADVLGCLYVLEGATLGGRIIGQHVHAELGITSATGGRFFAGYEGDTGSMWNAMRKILLRCAVDVQTENAIVANSIATFVSLRRWCDPDNACSSGHAGNPMQAADGA